MLELQIMVKLTKTRPGGTPRSSPTALPRNNFIATELKLKFLLPTKRIQIEKIIIAKFKKNRCNLVLSAKGIAQPAGSTISIQHSWQNKLRMAPPGNEIDK